MTRDVGLQILAAIIGAGVVVAFAYIGLDVWAEVKKDRRYAQAYRNRQHWRTP